MNGLGFGTVQAATIVWPGPSTISIAGIVESILPLVYGIAGLALFGLLLYGGFMWLTSAGDPEKIRKAVDTMLNAVIGIAIIVFAAVITRVVGTILGMSLI